ncbi:hypothetical protein [Nonomuraea sp. NPDC003709]
MKDETNVASEYRFPAGVLRSAGDVRSGTLRDSLTVGRFAGYARFIKVS